MCNVHTNKTQNIMQFTPKQSISIHKKKKLGT